VRSTLGSDDFASIAPLERFDSVLRRDEVRVPLEGFDGRCHAEELLSLEDCELRTLAVGDDVARRTPHSDVEDGSELFEDFSSLRSPDVRHRVGRSAVLEISAPAQRAVGPERDAERKRFGLLRKPGQQRGAFDVEARERRLTGVRMERDVCVEDLFSRRGVTRECDEKSEARPRHSTGPPHSRLTP